MVRGHSETPIPSSEDYTSPGPAASPAHLPNIPAFQFLLASAPQQHIVCAKAYIKPANQNLGTLSGLCCQLGGERGTTVWTWWEGNRSLDWKGGKLESASGSVCINASHLASLGLNLPLCKIKGELTKPCSSNPHQVKRKNNCKETNRPGMELRDHTKTRYVCSQVRWKCSWNEERWFWRASWGR